MLRKKDEIEKVEEALKKLVGDKGDVKVLVARSRGELAKIMEQRRYKFMLVGAGTGDGRASQELGHQVSTTSGCNDNACIYYVYYVTAGPTSDLVAVNLLYSLSFPDGMHSKIYNLTLARKSPKWRFKASCASSLGCFL